MEDFTATRLVGKIAEALDKPVDDYIDVRHDAVEIDMEKLLGDFFKVFRADVCKPE